MTQRYLQIDFLVRPVLVGFLSIFIFSPNAGAHWTTNGSECSPTGSVCEDYANPNYANSYEQPDGICAWEYSYHNHNLCVMVRRTYSCGENPDESDDDNCRCSGGLVNNYSNYPEFYWVPGICDGTSVCEQPCNNKNYGSNQFDDGVWTTCGEHLDGYCELGCPDVCPLPSEISSCEDPALDQECISNDEIVSGHSTPITNCKLYFGVEHDYWCECEDECDQEASTEETCWHPWDAALIEFYGQYGTCEDYWGGGAQGWCANICSQEAACNATCWTGEHITYCGDYGVCNNNCEDLCSVNTACDTSDCWVPRDDYNMVWWRVVGNFDLLLVDANDEFVELATESYETCGTAQFPCENDCDLDCSLDEPCGKTCWTLGDNNHNCGNYQNAICDGLCASSCVPSTSCDDPCWQNNSGENNSADNSTTCGESGNYCQDSCRVKCNLFSNCEEGAEACYLENGEMSDCGRSVEDGDFGGQNCGSCSAMCHWAGSCNAECLIVGGVQDIVLEDGDDNTEWTEDNWPPNTGGPYERVQYSLINCHQYGMCEQCASMCVRTTTVDKEPEGNKIFLEDVTGLTPTSGMVRLGDQLITYHGHNNKAVYEQGPGAGTSEAILYLPGGHPPVSAVEGDVAYPLNVNTVVQRYAASGSTELWVTDSRAFPDAGTLYINPYCVSPCNPEEGVAYTIAHINDRGTPGKLTLTAPSEFPHNVGEPVIFWLEGNPEPSDCDLICGDGNKPSTCGTYAMCENCTQENVCFADQACERQCWWNGQGYVDGDFGPEHNWLKTCGDYGVRTDDDATCKVCNEASCNDCLMQGGEACNMVCITEGADLISSCGLEGYAPYCEDLNADPDAGMASQYCNENVPCDLTCNNPTTDEGTNCGQYGVEKYQADESDIGWCRPCDETVCHSQARCGEPCFYDGESTTCAGAIMNGNVDADCKSAGNFNGQASATVMTSIGGMVVDCGPQPQSDCGCTGRWRGPDSYAECARQGSAAVGDHDAGFDGVWWVAGRLHREDQLFRAGVLLKLYLLGDVVSGQINANSNCVGCDTDDVTIENEPLSSGHLFLLVEPTLEDCGGEKSSGLYYRWKSDVYPVTRFGLCNRLKIGGVQNNLFGDEKWGEGVPGFFLPEDSESFKALRTAMTLTKVIAPDYLPYIQEDLPFVGLDPNTFLPLFHEWEGDNLSAWGDENDGLTAVTLGGWPIQALPLLDFTSGGNNCYNCEDEDNGGNGGQLPPQGSLAYALVDIDVGGPVFDEMDVLLAVPHLDNLLQLPETQARALLENAPRDPINFFPDLSQSNVNGIPYFQNFSFADTGIPFRLPDFRADRLQAEFFRTFPKMAKLYWDKITYAPVPHDFLEEQEFAGAQTNCGFRALFKELDPFIERWPGLAYDNHNMVDRFKIFMMGYVSAWHVHMQELPVSESPFVEVFYDYPSGETVPADYTEKYRNPGIDEVLNTEHDENFTKELYDTFTQLTGDEVLCPGAETFVNVWSAVSGAEEVESLFDGWPEGVIADLEFEDVGDPEIVRQLPNIAGRLATDDQICGGMPCFDEDNTLSSQGAIAVLRYLRNAWNLRNVTNRRALNSLIASWTVPGAEQIVATSKGLPILNNPQQNFDKYLASSATSCNPFVPLPHENNNDVWNGTDYVTSHNNEGDWSDSLKWETTFSLLGRSYGIELTLSLDTHYDLRGSISPRFIEAEADAGADVSMNLKIQLLGFSFFGIKITIGVNLHGDVAGASVIGNFYSGYDRKKINVDLDGNLRLRGPSLNINGYVSVRFPLIGGGSWSSGSSNIHNSEELNKNLFNIHHSEDNPLKVIFGKYDAPPAMCSLLQSEELIMGEIDLDDLSEDAVYLSPCDTDFDGVVDYICNTSPDPLLLPPDPTCLPDGSGRMVYRLVYNENLPDAEGVCFDNGGDIGCDYSAAMEPVLCGDEEVCENGTCVEISFDGEECVNPCSFEQSAYCRKCECDQGAEEKNPCDTDPPAFCIDELTLKRGEAPGICFVKDHTCDGEGLGTGGTLIVKGTFCVPGDNMCGVGGHCLPDPFLPQACKYQMAITGCGGFGKRCVEFTPGNANCVSGESGNCGGRCVMCDDDIDCGPQGSGWSCTPKGDCINAVSLPCITGTDCPITESCDENHQCVPDTTPPETVITLAPGQYSNHWAAFEFQCVDNSSCEGGQNLCKLAMGTTCEFEGTEPDCDDSRYYQDLDEGVHTFCVWAVDAAGNRDPIAAKHQWMAGLDFTYPETTIDVFPEDNSLFDIPITFEFSCTVDELFGEPAPDCSYECAYNSAEFMPCNSPWEGHNYSTAGSTVATFVVKAIDPYGNTEATPEEYSWSVDCGSPLPGDANMDGVVNVIDVVRVMSHILDEEDPLKNCGFVNGDCSDGNGIVNVVDIVSIVTIILTPD